MLTVYDPPATPNWVFWWRGSEALKASGEGWIVLERRGGTGAHSLVSPADLTFAIKAMCEAYQRDSLLLGVSRIPRVTPAFRCPPTLWDLLRDDENAFIYRVPLNALDAFESFYIVVVHHAQTWFFWLGSGEWLKVFTDLIERTEPETLKQVAIQAPAAILDGELGTIIGILPGTPASRKLVQRLIQSGLAEYATEEPKRET